MAIKVIEKVYYVGVNDKKRKYFDDLVSLPFGTSYNSYLVIGSEKTALIDSVEPKKKKEFFKNIEDLGLKNIDFIVSNHAEQDHSGLIMDLLKIYPGMKVVTNPLCKNMLKDFFDIPDEKFIIVKDNEELNLGDKKLRFIMTPWVHWPETMITYLVEDKILFSCDLFGSHKAIEELYSSRDRDMLYSLKRYYAQIMMPFRKNIKNNLDKIRDPDINIIAPSHGPIHDEPKKVIMLYENWISDMTKKEVIVLYVSMHGSTLKAVEVFSEELRKLGIDPKVHNLLLSDIGDIAEELVDASSLVIAAPTVVQGTHPLAINAAYIINSFKPKTKYVSIINSYGWMTKTPEEIKGVLKDIGCEFLTAVTIKGHPKEKDMNNLKELARQFSVKE